MKNIAPHTRKTLRRFTGKDKVTVEHTFTDASGFEYNRMVDGSIRRNFPKAFRGKSDRRSFKRALRRAREELAMEHAAHETLMGKCANCA